MVLRTKLADIVGSLGAFTVDIARFDVASNRDRLPKNWRYSSLFSPLELAQIWHPPIGRSRVSNVARSPIVELEPPHLQGQLQHEAGVTLGRVVYRRQKDRVEISKQARLRHTFVIGRTGCGKSTLLQNMIVDDLRQHRGVCVVLVNLSKGRAGSDASSLLGALIVSSLQTSALSRADIPEGQRTDFYVYLDELSTLVSEGNDTFHATILSESRKYRTGYTLVTQFVDQLDHQTRSAVFGNCGSLVAMQCGIDDSRIIAEQLGEQVTPQMVAELPRYHAYARLLMDGTPTRPFALHTLPPPRRTQNRSEIIRKVSHRAYGRPLSEVEREIRSAYDA